VPPYFFDTPFFISKASDCSVSLYSETYPAG
jgi:hypothetical protein